LPEHLIGADPAYYLRKKLGGFGTAGLDIFDSRAYAEYERCFRDPATIHATCEDYRAAASIDLEHDAADAGRKIECPLLVLWGEKGVVHRCFDPIADWKSVARDVRGKALPSGHFVAEEAPEDTYVELVSFLRESPPRRRYGCGSLLVKSRASRKASRHSRMRRDHSRYCIKQAK
jgi:haloacetate dehalogenase